MPLTLPPTVLANGTRVIFRPLIGISIRGSGEASATANVEAFWSPVDGVQVGRDAIVGNARRVVAALLGRLLGRKAADVTEAADISSPSARCRC